MKFKSFLFDASILAAGIIAAAALGEVLLQVFWPQRSDVTVGMFESDPAAGYRLRSRYKSEVRVPEYRTRIRTDDEGYRVPDAEPTPRKGATRILAVGDSFTFGVGVNAEDAFPEELEARLNAGRGNRWDVRNGGVGGYGPQRTLRALRGRESEWTPGIIIHALYVGNDLEDAVPEPLSQDAQVKDGRLISAGHHPLLRLRLALRTRSHLYAFLRQNLYGLYRASGLWQQSQYLDPIGLATWPAKVNDVTWPAGKAAIAEIRDWAKERRIKYMVVVIPARWQVNDEAWDRYRHSWKQPEDAFDRTHAQREVFAALEEMGVPSVNLLPALRRAETSGVRTYYRLDPHWTREAHELAAQTIENKMRDLGWTRQAARGTVRSAGVATADAAG